MEKLKNKIKNYQFDALKDYSKNLKPQKTYMNYETDTYTQYQNYLYNRALKGLNYLPKEEVLKMCKKKRKRITNVYRRAQNVINVFKQEKTREYTNRIFSSLFPNTALTNFLLDEEYTDEGFKNTLNFKDLNIHKSEIITIFIDKGVLPKNFLSLKSAPNSLPQLRNESQVKRM
tara:strand:+ start:98 stop:619 length:522 start_codon:yes stop_codon:yes gene_type:complete